MYYYIQNKEQNEGTIKQFRLSKNIKINMPYIFSQNFFSMFFSKS